MNWQAHYSKLMTRAIDRVIEGYSERHHVIPRCLGGGNEPTNIVRLTPEEHYVAHQLLVKMYPANSSLLWAASNMTGKTRRMKRNNKLYGWLRRRLAAMLRKRVMSEATRQKLIASKRANPKLGKDSHRWGVAHDEEAKAKISATHKGKPKSAEHRAKLAAAKLGTKRPPRSEEWKHRQSEGIRKRLAEMGRLGFFDDANYRKSQSERMKKVWAQRKENPCELTLEL